MNASTASDAQRLQQAWAMLPPGARAALEGQWHALRGGGLACGAAVVDAMGNVVARGRNHAYEAAGPIETRVICALQDTRIAHAELNALAQVATDLDHERLTLWSTQHPCAMCAAAVQFVGIGLVVYLADDLSDASSAGEIAASRGTVRHEACGQPLWEAVSNLLFLHNPAVRMGVKASSIRHGLERCPRLTRLALDLADADVLGHAARSGLELPVALAPFLPDLQA